MNTSPSKHTSCLLLSAILLLGGCSGDEGASAIAAVNGSNLQRLTNLYSAYQFDHYGPGPANETEFKAWIKKNMGPSRLELMHIDPNNIDGVFISERDHKPFKIRYGVSGGHGSGNAVVFEQDGVDGKKQVGANGGIVMDVDDAQYQEMWSGKWHPPADPNAAPALPGAGSQRTGKSQ
jgi:hypothetical protein